MLLFIYIVLVAELCPTLCELDCIPWTVSPQAPLSMGFPRQEHWNGFPFPSLGDLPGPGIEPTSPELAGRFFTTEPLGKPSCRLLVGFKTRKVH